MQRIGRVIGLMGVTVSLLAGGHAYAESSPEAGLALAKRICSECHAVERAEPRSPNTAAPRFETIANVPGLTGAALSVALQTPHRTMPNVMLDANELSDIVAYILSLRRAN